jgi:hypothetical protein
LLRTYRSSWEVTWREISRYISPRRSRFFLTDVEAGGVRKEQGMISSAPRIASRTLAAGMMAGITSPARPWFRLTVPNPDLVELDSVKTWLSEVAKRMLLAMAKSNIYNTLHTLYGDLGDFGTACIFIDADDKNGMHSYSLPVGEFFLGQNDKGEIDALFQPTSLTVGQVVKKFGLDPCSERVKSLHKAGSLDHYIHVVHVVCPREDYDPSLVGPKNMPWQSCWFEVGDGNEWGVNVDQAADTSGGGSARSAWGLLLESGYAECPFVAGRWNVTGDDTYGTGPGWDALGDAKSLQLKKRKELQALERLVDPPLYGPRMFGNTPVSLLPGALNYIIQGGASGQEMKPVVQMAPAAIEAIGASVSKEEQQIAQTYFADLWLALSTEDKEMTAREVSERSSEKLLQLGPVMERLEDEVLNPIIERVFGLLLRSGQIPPPPPEIQGQPFRAEYLSIMAQAQKALSFGGIQQLAGFLENIATAKPEILDNVDFDKVASGAADALGVDPQMLLPAQQVAKIRQQRAKQQQAAQQQAQAMAQAQTAKTLSQSNTGGDNALTRMGGIVGAQAGAQ